MHILSAWLRSLHLLPAGAALLLAGVAHADFQPTDGYDFRPLWDGALSTEGVVMWSVNDYDGDPRDVLDEITFSVSFEGAQMPGTVELFPAGEVAEAYVVWRPTGSLPAGVYIARAEASKSDLANVWESEEVLELESSPVEPLRLDDLGVRLTTSPVPASAGRTVCCEYVEDPLGDAQSREVCQSEFEEEQPELVWDGLSQDRRPYSLVRTWLEHDSQVPVWSPWRGSLFDPSGQIITEPQDSYCVSIEVLDLLDGTITPARECIEHYDIELSTRDNDLDHFVRNRCGGSPAFWTDSGEQYVVEEDAASCSVGTGHATWSTLFVLGLFARRRRCQS